MTSPDIDYPALFAAAPNAYLVLDADLRILAVNDAHLRATKQRREDVVGRFLTDVFPDNLSAPDGGAGAIDEAVRRVFATGQPDTLAVQRYDIPSPGRPAVFEERWWSVELAPVTSPDGALTCVLLRLEELTRLVRYLRQRQDTGEPGMDDRGPEAELFARAEELQRLNAELKRDNLRERQIALRLQESMLHSPDLAHHPEIAVRYLPATGVLNVCGDWYDVTDVGPGRFAAAVGDVVGHGLGAAAVMGMLRSALSAVMRAEVGPGRALGILGMYAASVEGGLASTVVKVVVDTETHELRYSSAGHLPPVLLHPDGSFGMLDKATDPPLATRPEQRPRIEARMVYHPGDTLVMYTDGLVERRGEDITTGIDRLTSVLTEHRRHDPEHLADELLTRLGVANGAPDDVALLVMRL